jgi:hypothetical protein
MRSVHVTADVTVSLSLKSMADLLQIFTFSPFPTQLAVHPLRRSSLLPRSTLQLTKPVQCLCRVTPSVIMQDEERSALGKLSVLWKGILIVVSMYGLRLHIYIAALCDGREGSNDLASVLLFVFCFFLIAPREATPCLPNRRNWISYFALADSMTVHTCVRFEVFTAVTMKNVVFWDIKTQFVLHRRHITSPLHSPAGYCYVRFEVFTEVTMKNVFWDIKTQFVLHRRHITSPLQSPTS